MALDHSVIGKKSAPITHTYASRDTILYALGIGAKRDELPYLYEGKGPLVIPSFAVVPMFRPMFEGLSATKANLAMVVHGGQTVRVHAALPADATVLTTATVRAIYDMRKWATVVLDMETRGADGALLAENTSQIIVRGEGGFGGAPNPKEESPAPVPKGKEPDFVIEELTSPEQALLYRLSGDVNPLHADPAFAASVGFEQGPILHGLCSFGYMVRHAAKGAANGDASNVKAFSAQFRRPVWPGDTIVTKGWKIADKSVALEVHVKEREGAVIAGAWAILA